LQMDVDGNGKLDAKEFERAMRSLEQTSEQEIKEISKLILKKK